MCILQINASLYWKQDWYFHFDIMYILGVSTVTNYCMILLNILLTYGYRMFNQWLPFQVVRTENSAQTVRTSVTVRMERRVTLGRGRVSVPWGTWAPPVASPAPGDTQDRTVNMSVSVAMRRRATPRTAGVYVLRVTMETGASSVSRRFSWLIL